MKTSSLAKRNTVSSWAGKALLLSVVITAGLYVIPKGQYIAYPLLLVSTLVHELGHGVAAVLMGGTFHKFVMHWDGSGVAFHSGAYGSAARAFISAGGLCGPAVGAAVCFLGARRTRTSRWTLGSFGALLVLAEILVVRNGFGFGFVAVLAAVLLVLAIWASPEVAQFGLIFFGVQLALSVFSRGDYLFTDSAGVIDGAKLPSDTKQMEVALGLPYWFWGGLCAAFSIAVLALGLWSFLRRGRS